jgi:hypothetical protein
MPSRLSLALTPDYSLLRGCGIVFQVLGWLAITAGTLMLLWAALGGSSPPHSQGSDEISSVVNQFQSSQEMALRIARATLALWTLMCGLIFLVLGLLINLAIDLARNSFKQAVYLSRLVDKAFPEDAA